MSATNQQAPVDGAGPSTAEPTTAHTLKDLLLRAYDDPEGRVSLMGSLACLVLFCVLFRDNIWHFFYAWTTDDNYSHGFLVPFLSLYFAGQVAARGPVPVRSGVVLGSCLLGLALLVRLLTIPLPIPFLGDLALLVGLAGAFALLLGSAALRRYWFAFFFLIFMVPLPIAMYSRIASPLQLLASRLASGVMNLTGVPVLCEGNRMTLPGGVQMFVAEACSGMRQITGFFALAAAVAYLIRRPGWYKAVVLLASLPIALTANVARVVLTGYIMHFVNREYASGAYHTVEGILMMGLGLLLLNTLCSLLNSLCQPVEPTGTDRGPGREPEAPAALPGRAVLTGPAGWTGGVIADNLVSFHASKEHP
ncbi:MAG: exosortase/archaeosortase family protein [Isosphaeraceae bacterium]